MTLKILRKPSLQAFNIFDRNIKGSGAVTSLKDKSKLKLLKPICEYCIGQLELTSE